MTKEEFMDESNANPVCTSDADLPEPPRIGEHTDPAEPHPDEPGVRPEDAAPRRCLDDDLV